MCSIYGFQMGSPLPELQSEENMFAESLAALQKRTATPMHKSLAFFFEKFGLCEKQHGTSNSVPNNACDQEQARGFGPVWSHFQGLFCAFLWGDYETAVYHADEHRAAWEFSDASVNVALFLLMDGLARVALYRHQKQQGTHTRRPRLRLLRGNSRRLHHICGLAPDYGLGKMFLLKAELASVTQKKSKKQAMNVIKAFKCAVSLSQTSQILFEHAMACELAGRYLLQLDLDHHQEGISYLEEACRLYQQWGGKAKEQHLKSDVSSIRSRMATNSVTANPVVA